MFLTKALLGILAFVVFFAVVAVIIAFSREAFYFSPVESNSEESCFNGLLDGDEEGIDCGGSCAQFYGRECFVKGNFFDDNQLKKFRNYLLDGKFLARIFSISLLFFIAAVVATWVVKQRQRKIMLARTQLLAGASELK